MISGMGNSVALHLQISIFDRPLDRAHKLVKLRALFFREANDILARLAVL